MDCEGKFFSADTSQHAMLTLRRQTSTVIDQERLALDRVRIKQEKEIEKMLEAEFVKQEVERRNADKAEVELQKQLQRE